MKCLLICGFILLTANGGYCKRKISIIIAEYEKQWRKQIWKTFYGSLWFIFRDELFFLLSKSSSTETFQPTRFHSIKSIYKDCQYGALDWWRLNDHRSSSRCPRVYVLNTQENFFWRIAITWKLSNLKISKRNAFTHTKTRQQCQEGNTYFW